MTENHNYCVIMAGGIGSRFWPLSRTDVPKQFIDFFGTGKTLLRQTYERFLTIVPADHIVISTHLSYTDLVRSQIPEIDPRGILHEPAHKGTAPSMALAAYHLRDMDAEANIVMVPADQFIVDEEAFRRDILQALDYAATHAHLVTMGIRPTRAETRYGYIQAQPAPGGGAALKVRTFTEKPEPDFARVFVESGEFYWNTGLFIWSAATIIDTMRTLLPDMIRQFDAVFAGSRSRDEHRAGLYRCYESFPHLSVDYAVIEKAPNMYMLTGSFGWTDIGRWEDVWTESPKDADGNVPHGGDTSFYNSRNNLVVTPAGLKTVVQDLDGYLVTLAGGVLVICPRDEHNIRKLRNDLLLKYGDEVG